MINCLFHEIIETPTHYVGCTSNEYPILDYKNHGWGSYKRGIKDLPHDEYPYTIKYSVRKRYAFCTECTCNNKKN